ncbi:hypothetical protein [Amphibacillus jilinensis]|uniref:hypothetical protein n=1 Tax=Amphibacillus jilinensis TaxID=1216008 RepID=UPI00030A49C7|nr:hypothetical protein [Amphibacillus jilinensis]
MPVVYIDSDVEMIEAESEWVWARSRGNDRKEGKAVYGQFRKSIFKSWVDAGWVAEKQKQLSLFKVKD